MAGFSNDPTTGESLVNAQNCDFSGAAIKTSQITTDGELLIGSSVAPRIRGGSLASSGSTITITPGHGTINLEAAASIPNSFTEDSGSATPAANNLDVKGATSSGGAATNINTVGSGHQVSVCLNNSISQPDTNAAATTGMYSLGGVRFLHNYSSNQLSTFVGKNSGNLTNTGQENCGIGAQSLLHSTTTEGCNAVGYNALAAVTTGVSNDAHGWGCLGNLSTGQQNCGYGDSSAGGLITGSYNISIGSESGNSWDGAESSNICIGNSGVDEENNTIRIGTQGSGAGQQNTCFIAGIEGVTAANPQLVTINPSTGQLGSQEFYAKIPITSAQLKDIVANPITLVAAPPANSIINVIKIATRFKYGGNNAFTLGDNVNAIIGSSLLTDIIMPQTNMQGTADSFSNNDGYIFSTTGLGAVSSGVIDGQPLTATCSADFTGNAAGDNSLIIEVIYWVSTLT